MATLTINHPMAQYGSPIDLNFWKIGEPQGAEDKQLHANAQCAVAHWENRTEHLLRIAQEDQDYVSVPFKPIKKVRVTYRHVGVMKPAPYPLNE